jgi:hypothetical protein
VEEPRRVDEDLVRVWLLIGFAVVENEFADIFRICLDVVMGGLDLSFFTGSASTCEGGETFFIDEDLCNAPVVGLLAFARGGGGAIDPLLIVLPVTLGGLLILDVDVLLVIVDGFMGNRLGD